MNTVTLITCDNLTEAHLIKGKLSNEGIDSFLTNENFTNLMPLYNNMLGSGVQIMVFANDYQRARELVKENIEPQNIDIVCPHCGSDNIGLGLGKNKVMKIFNIIMAILSAIPLGNLKPKYYCKNCKEEIK